MSMSWASPTESRIKISGEVIHIDHFGNAISNITMKDLDRFCPDGRYTVRIAGKFMAEAAETYGQKKPGTVMALTGSGNHLEIAVSQGSAAKELGILQGTPIEVMRRV
jgi:S-adenosylmethionine hydrolase